MEFPGVGTLCLDTPPLDLKPFMRRSLKVDSVSLRRKEARIKRQFEIWDDMIFFGNDSITKEEYLDEWLQIVFGSLEKRKKRVEMMMGIMKEVFDPIDTNKNGVIEFSEFWNWYKLRNVKQEKAKIVFDAIDSNKDGVISLTEWTYGYLEYLLNSGPDSPMSLWFGPITVNE